MILRLAILVYKTQLYNNTSKHLLISNKISLFFAVLDYHSKIFYKYDIDKQFVSESANSNIMKYKKILVFLKKN